MFPDLTLERAVEISITRLRTFEATAISLNPAGYFVAFSGGKDSVVILDLVRRAGVKHDVWFNFTTVDPPELTSFICLNYPDIKWLRPERSMFKLIRDLRWPPTARMRYCCTHLKEYSGKGRMVVTGVRWAESRRRKTYKMMQPCQKYHRFWLHPIIDWQTAEVWQYIRSRNLPYCSLYNEGRSRIGCVLCPMASRRERLADCVRWPKFVRAYKLAFSQMITEREKAGLPALWKSAEDVFAWWMKEPNMIIKDEHIIEEETSMFAPMP